MGEKKGEVMRKNKVDCKEIGGKDNGENSKLVSEIGEDEETAVMRIRRHYKFEVKFQSIAHIHHDKELSSKWWYQVVQIFVIKLWKHSEKYG